MRQYCSANNLSLLQSNGPYRSISSGKVRTGVFRPTSIEAIIAHKLPTTSILDVMQRIAATNLPVKENDEVSGSEKTEAGEANDALWLL